MSSGLWPGWKLGHESTIMWQAFLADERRGWHAEMSGGRRAPTHLLAHVNSQAGSRELDLSGSYCWNRPGLFFLTFLTGR